MKAAFGATLLVLLACGAWAQTRPSLAGRWTLDAGGSSVSGGGDGDKTGRASGGGGQRGGGIGLGAPIAEVTITQNATSLTISEQRGRRNIRTVCEFDGQMVKNSMWVGNISRGRVAMALYSSNWEGARLVTMITTNPPIAVETVVFKEVRYLDPEGRMVVETTSVGNPGGRIAVYKKAPPAR